jgi:hypothetical protein
MGFLDKVKQGAEQAKTMASHAAERAKEEAKELNLKRQISNEEEALGRVVFGLVERGELSHAEVTPGVERIRALRAELEEIQTGQGGAVDGENAAPSASDAAPASGESAGSPAAGTPPPGSTPVAGAPPPGSTPAGGSPPSGPTP